VSELIPLLLFVVLIVISLAVILSFVPIGLWISALAARVPVGIFALIGMRLRRVAPVKIVVPLIKATKAGPPGTR
jgi:uncharacterized protein YqfA (UPF0365 family)